MQIKTIHIKNILSSQLIRDHVLRFFRNTIINSQYIDFLVKIAWDNESIFYSLSRLTTLDITNISYIDNNFVPSLQDG